MCGGGGGVGVNWHTDASVSRIVIFIQTLWQQCEEDDMVSSNHSLFGDRAAPSVKLAISESQTVGKSMGQGRVFGRVGEHDNGK